MIKVIIVRDNQGFIWEFSLSGHAEFGDYGSDIVCSAVSALAQTAVAALQKLAGIKKYTKGGGYLKCSIPRNAGENEKYIAKIILETMVIGIKQIERSYRDNITVIDEEVQFYD
jgi:uncharacterized protein YsxB (DUF464 family)